MTKKPGGKGKSAKLELVFSEKDRRDYLTGFKKRKQERREVAAKKFDNRFKQEKNRIRNEKRSARPSFGPTVLPDNMLISEAAETVTHELPDHTVSVTSIADMDLRADSLFPGGSQLTVDAEEAAPPPEEADEAPGMALKQSMSAREPEKPAVTQRSRQNILQTKLKMQEKKNKQKSKNLQKHKSRVRKAHMKKSHQIKRQKKGKSI